MERCGQSATGQGLSLRFLRGLLFKSTMRRSAGRRYALRCLRALLFKSPSKGGGDGVIHRAALRGLSALPGRRSGTGLKWRSRVFIREIREIRGSIPLVAAGRAGFLCGLQSVFISSSVVQTLLPGETAGSRPRPLRSLLPSGI